MKVVILLSLLVLLVGAHVPEKIYVADIYGLERTYPPAFRIGDSELYAYLPTSFNSTLYVTSISPYTPGGTVTFPGAVTLTDGATAATFTGSGTVDTIAPIKANTIQASSGTVITCAKGLSLAGAVTSTTASSSGGITTTGIKFANNGQTLNYHKYRTMSLTASGPFASGAAMSVAATKLGTFVVINFPQTIAAAGSAAIITVTAVDTDLFPTSQARGTVTCQDNSVNQICYWTFSTSGVLTVARNTAGTQNFLATGNVGIYPFGISYTII